MFLVATAVACDQTEIPVTQQLAEMRAQRATLDEKIRALEVQVGSTTEVVSIPVGSFTTKRAPFQHVINVKGTVDSRSTIEVAPQMSGRITSIKVSNGQTVSKGQVLLELDAELLKSNVAEVRTQLEFANTMYEKQKRIYDQQAGSEIQYLQSKTNKESLERRLESLTEQLALMKITAQTSGYIDNLTLSVGEMVMAGMPVLTIVNTSDMRVVVDLAEPYMKSVGVGDPVTVEFPEMEHSVSTKVGVVARTVNPVNRTFWVEIPLHSTSGHLRPNTTASVSLNDITVNDAISVPLASILREGAEEFVYVIGEDSKVSRRTITTGLVSGSVVEVTSGLEANEAIVVSGNQDVTSGQSVRVIE